MVLRTGGGSTSVPVGEALVEALQALVGAVGRRGGGRRRRFRLGTGLRAIGRARLQGRRRERRFEGGGGLTRKGRFSLGGLRPRTRAVGARVGVLTVEESEVLAGFHLVAMRSLLELLLGRFEVAAEIGDDLLVTTALRFILRFQAKQLVVLLIELLREEGSAHKAERCSSADFTPASACSTSALSSSPRSFSRFNSAASAVMSSDLLVRP